MSRKFIVRVMRKIPVIVDVHVTADSEEAARRDVQASLENCEDVALPAKWISAAKERIDNSSESDDDIEIVEVEAVDCDHEFIKAVNYPIGVECKKCGALWVPYDPAKVPA
jgi:hypothetical protein